MTTISKNVQSLGMPWEDAYGYAQAVKVGDTIYLSGQLSHDDRGDFVGAPPLDDQGRITDHSNSTDPAPGAPGPSPDRRSARPPPVTAGPSP